MQLTLTWKEEPVEDKLFTEEAWKTYRLTDFYITGATTGVFSDLYQNESYAGLRFEFTLQRKIGYFVFQARVTRKLVAEGWFRL